MQIQVIDQQQADPQRLRAMFVVRALRALDRLAPGILKLVGRFRDLNGPKGGIDHACTIAVEADNLEVEVGIDAIFKSNSEERNRQCYHVVVIHVCVRCAG